MSLKQVAISAIIVLYQAIYGFSAEHTKDSLDTVKKNMQDKSAVLLDVREQKEWDSGHLKDAKLVPLSKLRDTEKKEAATKDVPKDKIVYCHCGAGVRVLEAADILKKQGYDIRPLKQGYKDLLNAGFPKAEK